MTKFITETHKHTLGVLLLVVTALILGTIPVAIKEAIASFSPATQFAIRFTIAAIIITPFVRNLNRNLLRDGAILGVSTRSFIGAAMVLVGIILTLISPKIEDNDSELSLLQESLVTDGTAQTDAVLVVVLSTEGEIEKMI